MKTIIALKGKANSGKTTTITILHDRLLDNGYELKISDINEKVDFSSVFTKNNKIVGITSSGDTYDIVYNKLTELIKNNCIICVCACRTKDLFGHGTNAAINEFTEYEHQFINKTIGNTEEYQKQNNNSDATNLLNIIENLVK